MRANMHRAFVAVLVSLSLLCAPFGVAASTTAQQALALEGVTSSAGATGAATVKSKDESVYAALDADGSVKGVYIVNRFELTSPGTITDYGDYSAVENLTDTSAIKNDDGVVTAQATGLNFDYKGTLAKSELPWNVSITYELDGKKIAPADLAGKSGAVKIRIATSKNNAFDAAFYDNFTLQIALKIDTSIGSDIQASGATVADAGSYKTISYIALAGNDVDATVSATVTDFALPGISVNAVPLSMGLGLPDADGMVGQFQTLSDALTELDEGVGSLQEGVGTFKDGSSSLVSGSSAIEEGLAGLSDGSIAIVGGSQGFKDALDAIVAALEGETSGGIDLSGLTQLPGALRQVAGGLDTMASELATLNQNYATAHGALEASVQGIPASTMTQQKIDALRAAAGPGEQGTIDELVAGYEAAQTVKGTYTSVEPVFDAVTPALTGAQSGLATSSGALNDIATNVENSLAALSGLDQLVQALKTLAQQYGYFHAGLVSFMDGLQTLASQYAAFHAGVESFDAGIAGLYQGVSELHGGTTQMSEGVAELPETVQAEIDSLIGQYDKSDFAPVSFASAKNTNIGSVQFVMQSDAIEKNEQPKQASVQEEQVQEQTFWDRLMALFT